MPLPYGVAYNYRYDVSRDPNFSSSYKLEMDESAPNRIVRQATKCIYCDGVRYWSATDRPRGGEHIVAYAIGGNAELGAASCHTCEKATNSFETPILNDLLWGPRFRMKIRTHTKSTIKLTTTIGGVDHSFPIRLDHHPTLLILPIFSSPTIVRNDFAQMAGFCGTWIRNLNFTRDTLSASGVHRYISPSIDVVHFCQMLAKTAHAYAMATVGENAFLPFLRTFIRKRFGKEETWRSRYAFVGGCSSVPPPAPALHELECGWYSTPTRDLLIVRVRYFASLGAPNYYVVTGQRRP